MNEGKINMTKDESEIFQLNFHLQHTKIKNVLPCIFNFQAPIEWKQLVGKNNTKS